MTRRLTLSEHYAAARRSIGQTLRGYYDEVVREPLPAEWLDAAAEARK